MQLWGYTCENEACERFEGEWEELVQSADKDGYCCPSCGALAHRMLNPTAGWEKSKERTSRQLMKRSIDHHRECVRKGVDPSSVTTDETSFRGDPVWNNKTRAKNQSKTRIEDLSGMSKGWTEKPKTEII